MKSHLYMAAAMIALFPVQSHAAVTVYTATLTGAAEAPPNGSPGSGTAFVTIDDIAQTMRVQASFSGLTGPVTAAHIHCCTAVPGAGNAGVATPTPSFPGFPGGVMAGTYDHSFDMSLASSWNAAFLLNNGGTTQFAFGTLLNGLLQGRAYFNIHTQVFPGGEIRGFLAAPAAGVPEPASWAMMLAGFGLVGWAMRRGYVKTASA